MQSLNLSSEQLSPKEMETVNDAVGESIDGLRRF